MTPAPVRRRTVARYAVAALACPLLAAAMAVVGAVPLPGWPS